MKKDIGYSKSSDLRILVAGYYGEGNLGDELVLLGLLRGIKERFKGTPVTLGILTGNFDETRRFIDGDAAGGKEIGFNYIFVPRKSIVKIISAIASSDIVIVGGGGLFQDFTGSLSLYYYLLIIFISKIFGKKVSVCSVGIDRMKGINSYLARAVINLADRISVRDAESLEFLVPRHEERSASAVAARRSRRRPPEVKQFADLAFNISFEGLKVSSSNHEFTSERRKPKFIFVPRKFGGHEDYSQFWSRLADMCARRYSGSSVVLAAFHKKEDVGYITRIASLCQMKPDILLWENPSDVIREFMSSEVVISARLHGLILAALLGVPVVGVSSDRKSDLFLREIEQKNIYRSDDFKNSGDEMAFALISDTLRWSDDFRQKLSWHIERLKKNSRDAVDYAFS